MQLNGHPRTSSQTGSFDFNNMGPGGWCLKGSDIYHVVKHRKIHMLTSNIQKHMKSVQFSSVSHFLQVKKRADHEGEVVYSMV